MGLESIAITSTNNDIGETIDFCRRLRDKDWARDSTIIFIVESNYGGHTRAAEFIAEIKPRFQPLKAISEDVEGKSREGIWLTHDYKERMVRFANTELYNDRIAFHTDIVSKSCVDPEHTLIEQMQRFQRVFMKTPTAHSAGLLEPKLPFKYSGKGNGKKDDVCMSFLECIFFYDRYFLDTGYDARDAGMTIGAAAFDLVVQGEGLAGLRWQPRRPTTGLEVIC